MKHARPDYNRIQDPAHKIPMDEPVLLIRGQDRVAAFVSRVWCIANYITGGSTSASKMVWRHARKMSKWHTHKSCDLPGE